MSMGITANDALSDFSDLTISGGEHLPQAPWTDSDLDALARHPWPSIHQDAASLLDELAREPGVVLTLEALATRLGRSSAGVIGTLSKLSRVTHAVHGRRNWPLHWREQGNEYSYALDEAVALSWRGLRGLRGL
ncbi:DUF6416 domain-containing protein [Streptomyces abikoensis]|uniref:DUF6416 domain-containing protein n=1 Tax=Streptomyces abikoensis TaxID=97398 RepID=UPI003406D3B6